MNDAMSLYDIISDNDSFYISQLNTFKYETKNTKPADTVFIYNLI